MKQTYTNRTVSIREDGFYMDMSKYGQSYDPEVKIGDLDISRDVEFDFVISGAGFHRVMNQAFPCQSGDVFILNKHIPHCYYTSEKGTSLTVRRMMFSPEKWFGERHSSSADIDYLYGCFCENPNMAYTVLTKEVCEQTERVFDEIAVEFRERKDRWREAVKAHLTLLFITIARYSNRAIKNTANLIPGVWNPIVGIIAFVHENYKDSSLTLDSIANQFHLSRAYLSRLFKHLTGETFTDFLKNFRLENACHMLVETDKTVEEIIKDCGMKDTTSFYTAFGKCFGMTPNQYRKQHIQEKTKKNILKEISDNLQKGKGQTVAELVKKALDEGVAPQDILQNGLLNGLSIVGERFRNNELFVPDVMLSARSMNKGSAVLKPYFVATGEKAVGRVCIGTVKGDLHDIGKNLVVMMLEGRGLEVIDLGTDVSPETFVKTAIDLKCRVICCSALLTTTMGVMEEVVKKATQLGIRDKVKIMIGGAPVTREYCEKIGADLYTPDAASAADAAVEFCKTCDSCIQ